MEERRGLRLRLQGGLVPGVIGSQQGSWGWQGHGTWSSRMNCGNLWMGLVIRL